jgi:hypothetical protein
MIDRAALMAMTPAARAALIYGEARAAASQRLWDAALGSAADDTRAERRPRERSALDTLLDQIDRRAAAATPPPPPRQPPAIVLPEAPSPAPRDGVGKDRDAAERQPTDRQLPAQVQGLGVNARYRATLEDAATRTGIPAPALAAIVDAEASKARDGSWQPFSRNPRSSAAGLGQFLSRTWEGLAETDGTWLNREAHSQGWIGGDGQVRADGRQALLALRYDAVAAINGVADYARRNLDGLRRAGVDVAGDVAATARLAYVGHHLGLGDAIRFLRQGGLSAARARTLLCTQVGTMLGERRIAQAGDATVAHRDWLIGYLDRKVRIRPAAHEYSAT